MNGRRLFLFAALLLFFTIRSSPAAAQDLAAAEVLFNTGVADMEAGKLDTACPAIAESQRLDPRPGTQFTLADCYYKAGKLATAAVLYEDYLGAVSQMTTSSKLRHAVRARVATAQKAALIGQIPELTLTLPASAPKDVRVTRDGTELTAATLGIALPLDPGEHIITVQVGSGPATEQRVTLGKGEKKAIELQLPEQKPVLATVTTTATTEPVKTITVATTAPGPGGSAMSGRRIGALVAGGVGVAGFALGGAMGGLVLSKKSTIDGGCTGGVCTAEGKSAADSIQIPGMLSTIGFAAGAVGLATGLVLFFTEPSSPGKEKKSGKWTATVLGAGPDGAALGVKGVF